MSETAHKNSIIVPKFIKCPSFAKLKGHRVCILIDHHILTIGTSKINAAQLLIAYNSISDLDQHKRYNTKEKKLNDGMLHNFENTNVLIKNVISHKISNNIH